MLIIWGGWGLSSWRGGISEQGGRIYIIFAAMYDNEANSCTNATDNQALTVSNTLSLLFWEIDIGLSPLVERLFTILATICCLTSLFTITQELVESLHPRAG